MWAARLYTQFKHGLTSGSINSQNQIVSLCKSHEKAIVLVGIVRVAICVDLVLIM